MPSRERPEIPLRRAPIDDLPRLDARTPAAEAFEALAGRSAPLVRLAGEGPDRYASTLALRFALQDEPDRASELAALADASLVCDGEAAARAKLESDPTLEAVVLEEGASALLVREVPDVRLAVVMAGGFGSRLRPLTDSMPKPLLEVGGRPLLFRILDDLATSGVERARISIRYLGEMVREAVGDGSAFGLEVGYLEEREPLDTGAGLAQLGPVDEPFFVVNGDVLTGLDFRALGRFHQLVGSLGTVATYRFSAPLPYGVVHASDHRIEGIQEKPVFEYPVNAGIYAFSAEASRAVEPGRPLAMVDFLNRHASRGRVARFPVVEAWSDVGSAEALARARAELEENG